MRQGVVGPLACGAGGVAFISKSSNSIRSFVKPALHVGKHSGGFVGCLAAAESGGIAGGGTATT